MSFGIIRQFKASVNKSLFERQAFALVYRLNAAERTSKYGLNVTQFVRFQHSSKPVDLTKTTTSGAAKELKIDDEELISKSPGKISPKFPLKQATKSAQILDSVAATSPNEKGFCEAIEIFKKRDVRGMRVMDFISTAITYMEAFGVSKNIESYNQLIDIFPKGKYHNKTVFDTLWTRHRPQIDCAVQVLTKLEENGVRPNVDTYDIVHAVFGNDGIPLNKLRRIVFWFDKFDEIYPDPLPKELPSDKQDLFKIAINRMIDENFTISVKSYENFDGIELQVIGAKQNNLSNFLEDYDARKPVFVEGPNVMWLRKTRIYYYVLKADVNPDTHAQDDILAVCIVNHNEGGTELKIWIKELQRNYPKLAELNVIFNFQSNNEQT